MKVAFLVKDLSALRGAPILLFNFANAVSRRYDVHTLVVSIESSNTPPWNNYFRSSFKGNRYIPYAIPLSQIGLYNLIPKVIEHSICYKCFEPLDVSALIFTLHRSKVARPEEISALLAVLAKRFDVIHTGLWREQFSFSVYMMRRKVHYSGTAKFVIHPMIHPSPFAASTQTRKVRFINYVVDKIGYKSLIRMLRNFDGITVSTPYELKLLRSYGLNNVWFVGEGVDLQWTEKNIGVINQKAREIREGSKSGNIVTFIGFRNKHKGYYDFLKAILILLRKKNIINQQKLRVFVLGRSQRNVKLTKDDIECRLIEEKLVRNGLMVVNNFLPEIDKYALICASDVIVLPSYGETIPLVFLEAWALKRPVVGYKIPTVSSIIKFCGDGGFLVDPGDVEKLANVIHMFLLDSRISNQTGLRGYMKVKEHYNLESVAKKLIQVYNHVSSP